MTAYTANSQYRCLRLYKLFITILTVLWSCSYLEASAKKQLIVGIYENPPKTFIDGQGEIKGLFPELLNYIAKQERWEIIYQKGTWAEQLEELKQGRLDILVDMAYSTEREKEFLFVDEPTIANWAVVYSKSKNKISSFPDLQGKRIAVMKKSIYTNDKQHGIIPLLKKFHIKATFIPVSNYDEVFQLVADGLVDAGITNRIYGDQHQKKFHLKDTGIYFNPVTIHFALAKEKPELREIAEILSRHLKKQKEAPDSFYQKLLHTYLFPPRPLTPKQDQTTLLYVLGSVIIVAGFLVIIILFLRQQIRQRTRQISQQNEELKETVTKLKTAEKERQESRERLTLALEASNTGLWDLNPLTQDVYFSDKWFTMLGYAPGTFPPNRETWTQLLHPDDKEKASQAMNLYLNQRPFNTNTLYDIEFRLKTQSGDWKWIRSMAKAFAFDDQNRVIRMIGTHTDISRQKETLLALEQSEELHEKAQRLAHIGHWKRDLNHEKTIWSPEIYRIFELNPQTSQVDFKFILNLIHPKDRDFFQKTVNNACQNYQGYKITYRLLLPNDKVKYVKEQCSVEVDQQKKNVLLVGTTQDITELKEIEQEKVKALKQLRKDQKLKAIGTLAGGIAHDFNNILTPIIGYAQMALEEIEESNALTDYLAPVLKSSLRAKNLIQQILTFSREKEQELRPLRIQPVIKETLQLIRSTLPSTIEIKENIASQTDLINGDPTQLHQVVMNLCTNAFQAMKHKGGTLDIQLQQLELTNPKSEQLIKLSPGSYLKLSVKDTGCGISGEIMDKIFDPYFTTRDKMDGTGLGLAVVHGIIESLGGEISVQSKLDIGTTFNIWLPIIQSELEKIELFPNACPQGTEHILLVDDEKALLEMLEKMLTKLGYKITSCNSSQEALEVFQKTPELFEILLTDLNMPSLNGLNLCREIKALKKQIKVILCTGFSSDLTDAELNQAGVDALLLKPIIKNKLSKTIRSVLEVKTTN